MVIDVLRILLIVAFVFLFFINILQVNNIESRIIKNASRMEELADTTKELRVTVESLTRMIEGGGGISVDGSTAQTSTREWLHPEVENLLVKEEPIIVDDDAIKKLAEEIGDEEKAEAIKSLRCQIFSKKTLTETLKEDGLEDGEIEKVLNFSHGLFFRPEDASKDGTIRRHFGTNPKGFNPLTVNDGSLSNYIKNYCMDSFASHHWSDPDLWKPQLAERIEITDDYKEYTIYLKKGIRWHKPAVDWSNPRYKWLKGEHYVTAQDVKFTIDLILNPQVECAALRNYYTDLEYCKVIDDYTVVFKWKKKTYNSISFTVGFAPIPEFLYAFDEDGERFDDETLGFKFNNHWYNFKFIGNGPYEFVSYEPGVSIKLKRNEDYYDEKPAIKNITYLIYGDTFQNVLKMKSDELDFVSLTPTQYREEILGGADDSPFKNGKILNQRILYLGYSYIGWNMDNPLFSDKRVRKAMAYAFNGKDILDNVFLGLGELVTGPFFLESPAYNKTLSPYDFDLNKAKELLAEAGWKDVDGDGILEKEINGEMRDFEFGLLLFGRSAEWKTTGNIFQEDLLKIGVKMNMEPLDWAVMQKRMEEKDFEAYTGAWTMNWESDPYQIWHSSQADIPKSSNRIGFRNEEADKIIEDLRVTFDQKKRVELYHNLHEIIYEEQPYIFFRASMVTYTWQDYVKNMAFRKGIRPQADSSPWYIQ